MAEELVRLTFHLEAEQIETEAGDKIGIGTHDLVDFAQVIDNASTAVAWQAAWEIIAGLDLSGEELGTIAQGMTRQELWERRAQFGRRDRRPSGYFSPGQVTRVEDGSITVAIVVGGGFAAKWAWKNLFGDVVKEGWEESAGREKMKRVVRGIFGGAAKAAEEAVSGDLPGDLSADGIEVESKTTEETEIFIRIRKRSGPEL